MDCEFANTPSKKQASFRSTPLQAIKSLLQVPGVGGATLEKLTRAGVTTPQQLVGQFMMLNRDTNSMIAWLKSACGVRQKEADTISEALLDKTERMGVL